MCVAKKEKYAGVKMKEGNLSRWIRHGEIVASHTAILLFKRS